MQLTKRKTDKKQVPNITKIVLLSCFQEFSRLFKELSQIRFFCEAMQRFFCSNPVLLLLVTERL